MIPLVIRRGVSLEQLWPTLFPPGLRAKGLMVKLCTAYIDESGTSGPIMVATACIGDRDKWSRFERRWIRMLDTEMPTVPPRKRFFHMLTFNKREDQFEGWD
ncbi:MAG TPA: hypothetical protein VGW35_10685, partial [Methylomirabilota bacterium]|nr:hypothetical protein [Methylomirabilota bacterium]